MKKVQLIVGIFTLTCLLACNKNTTKSAVNVAFSPKDSTISVETKIENPIPSAKKSVLQQIVTFFRQEKKENAAVSTPTQADTISNNMVQDSVLPPSQAKAFEMPLISLQGLMWSLSQAPKPFSIPATEPTAIELPQGTQILIPQGAFMIEETEEPVNGNVLVIAQEYLGIEDILRANLSTMSPEGMLETGGMLYVEAMYEGKRCVLRKDKKLQILIPTQGRKKDKNMQLFSGGRDENGQMLWDLLAPDDFFKQDTLVRTSLSTMDSFLQFVKKSVEDIKHFSWAKIGKPVVQFKRISARGSEYVGSEMATECPKDYFSLNKFQVKYCDVKYEKGNKKTDTIISFFKKTEKPFNFHLKVQADLVTGKLISPRYADQFAGIPTPIAAQMARMIRKQKWTPGENEVDFEVFISEKYKQKIDEKYGKRLIDGDCEQEYRSNYAVYVKNYKPIISYYSPTRMSAYQQMQNYIFSTTKLGWINCDRFLNVPEKTDLMVDIGKATDLQAYMIFHKIRSVISTNIWEVAEAEENGFCRFGNIPKDEKVTLFVIKTENNKQFYALKDTHISNEIEENLDFKPLDRQTLAVITQNLGERFN